MQWFQEYKELVFSSETSVERIDKAIRLKFDNLPKLLYKYRAINKYSLKNLEEDSIWLSDPRNFNDPYDCSFTKKDELDPYDSSVVLDMALKSGIISNEDQASIEAILSSETPTTTLMELSYPDRPEYAQTMGDVLSTVIKEQGLGIISELSENMKKAFKVCCFSEDPKSILMWSHYADYHKGFCIAYDFGELGNEDLRTRMLYPVIYSNSMFDASGIFSRNKTVNNILYINQAALIKSREWQYEKEWRLVFGNGTLAEEIGYQVPKAKFVILGTKIAKEDADKIIEICDRKGIEVKQMQMSPVRYELDYQTRKVRT
ncbi:DUF2971 domain-containing protein [Vibrio vulnificus]|uniref:DUF2971 domain-containing protein n=1 Tax=Vibrio vulnificus TaxID=672 RepID=UPI0004F92F1B|nr:DUF2971 domain-containing protein [Vibrio vulnificus]AIL70781.1 hypothetical protein VV93_v1c16930 [Vibrio vulnificus]MCJ0824273.1 DUF2971 domain-containing protein [Vibrio vulnificus]MDS1864207.1 DUF2971 domain-containing protein [Vibrio vulnificus]